MTAPLSVVVLTKNEARNLPGCLATVCGWAEQVFVVDSASTDGTQEIAQKAGATVVDMEFRGYAQTRNAALRDLPHRHEWVMFLDADERLTPELRDELSHALASSAEGLDGYEVKRRFYWRGRWIKHGGYYPVWLLRIVRRGHARCEDRAVNEHLLVDGRVARLKNDIIHDDQRDLSEWLAKHDAYARMEAAQLAARPVVDGDAAQQRQRAARWRAWRRMPPLVRPFLYFGYRYGLRLGFLDGAAGLEYHFLHGLYYMFLIDVRYLEIRRRSERS